MTAHGVIMSYAYDSGDALFPITVARVGRRGDAAQDFDWQADVWAVRWKGWCLDCDGAWVHEPLPSSRDAEFLDRTRWPEAEARSRAYNAAVHRRTLEAMPR